MMAPPHRRGGAVSIFRARQATATFVAALLLLVCLDGSSARTRAGRATSLADLPAVAQQIVQQTNAFRGRNGASAVNSNVPLSDAAQRFAEYMARTERYGHEADGRQPADRATAHGYEYCIVAENIGYQMSSLGFSTDELATRFVDGWEQSPGHRRNMLLPNVIDIGVGVAYSKRTQRYYAVQMFGRPRSASTRFEVSNRGDAVIRYALDGREFSLAPRVTRTHDGCFEGPLTVRTDGDAIRAITPRDGARYLLQRDGSGQWQVQVQQ